MDLKIDWIGFVVGTGVTTLVWGAIVWFGKEAIARALDRSLQKDVEKYKAELSSMQDRLKHELQKDMLRAQSKNDAIHRVYPELFEKLQVAHGMIGGLLGVGFEPTYEEFEERDFKRALKESHATFKTSREVLSALRTDREEGVSKLRAHLRNVKFGRASEARRVVINFRLIKALYLSPEVRKTCDRIIDSVGRAFSLSRLESQKIPYNFQEYFDAIESATKDLVTLQDQMAIELSPLEGSHNPEKAAQG